MSSSEMDSDGMINEAYDDSELIGEETESKYASIKRWYQLITSPLDLQLVINEKLEMINWDAHAKSLAKPLGNFLTVLFFVTRLLQDNLIKPNYYKLNVKSGAFDLSKSNKLKEFDYLWEISSSFQDNNQFYAFQSWYFVTLRFMNNLFKFTIFILLSLNLYVSCKFMFGYLKTYNLFHLKKEFDSPNLTKHNLSDLSKEYYEDIYKQSLWSMLKHFFRGSHTDAPYIDQDEDEIFYQLKKWTPTNFMINLFVSFSPTAIVFLSFSDVTFTTAIAIIIHQYILDYVITKRFQRSVDDDLILSSAALQEYEDKHIIARTHEYGNTNTLSSAIGTRPKTPRIFTTHSLRGEEIREVYNYKKKEFEALPKMTENVPESRETGMKVREGISQIPGNHTYPIGFRYSPKIIPYLREKGSNNDFVQLSLNQNLKKDGAHLPNQDQNTSKSLSPLRKTPLSTRQKSFEGSEFNALNKDDIDAILRSPKKKKNNHKK
ncbi:Nur1p [Saccharomyces paradoxus]|uniref:Nuclear rim protein 1 n=1 Tax=Saccharomyces paradoxus TaxID=27291 RepID=A0A8B8UN36_SACPA|nr:Nur1 [Saccharomyces paradoxus]QHS72147.1 Nur1 [Saccharomyces paradoxus]